MKVGETVKSRLYFVVTKAVRIDSNSGLLDDMYRVCWISVWRMKAEIFRNCERLFFQVRGKINL